MAPRILAVAVAGLTALAGCAVHRTDPRAEPFGKTIYLDGAGNWGFGVAAVPAGLKDAG